MHETQADANQAVNAGTLTGERGRSVSARLSGRAEARQRGF